MKMKVAQWLEENEVNPNTISFYATLNENGDTVDAPDTEFTTCDISGKLATCVNCVALTTDGTLIEFQARDGLVGGALGRAAGAF